MKLAKLQLVDYRKPFMVGFHSPQTDRRAAESVFLKLTFDNGGAGIGECTPRPYVTGENCRSVIDTIKDLAAPVLFGHDLDGMPDLVATLAAIERRCLLGGARPYRSALTAIELALLDALGRHTGVHIAALIGRPPVRTVARSISIPFLPTGTIRALFERLQHLIAIDAVKILMKSDLDENIQRVAFVRALMGAQMPIRIEANGKWSFREAVVHAERLAPYGILSIEEPIRDPRPERLRQLRRSIGIPVILDESVSSREDAAKMIAADACDGFNLKLSKCGGLLNLMALADLAGQHHLTCQLGTHVGEGPILDAAGLYAASCHPVFTHYEGYSSLLFLDLDRPSQCLGSLMETRVDAAPGLGVDHQCLAALFDSPQRIEMTSTAAGPLPPDLSDEKA